MRRTCNLVYRIAKPSMVGHVIRGCWGRVCVQEGWEVGNPKKYKEKKKRLLLLGQQTENQGGKT
jgi:hypothetical protein